MTKNTSGRHAAAKTTLLQRLRANRVRREAQWAAWAATNTNPEGIS